MKANKNIQHKIDHTLESINSIETVHVSPYFKDKTMRRMFAEKEDSAPIWYWFSPKLQLATLACIIALNIIAFKNMKENSYDKNINQFSETYGLSIENENSIFN